MVTPLKRKIQPVHQSMKKVTPRRGPMSQLGHLATSAYATAISVRDSIADVAARASWVRLVPKAEFALPAEIPSGGERQPQLRRLVCKRNLATRLRQNNTTGKSPKTCPAPIEKIFRLPRRGKSVAYLRPSHPIRGAGRDRHERGLRCGGRGSVGAKRHRRADLP
jgi:hypothetical protein